MLVTSRAVTMSNYMRNYYIIKREAGKVNSASCRYNDMPLYRLTLDSQGECHTGSGHRSEHEPHQETCQGDKASEKGTLFLFGL